MISSMTALRYSRTYQTIGAFCESLAYHAYPFDERKRARMLFNLLTSVESVRENGISALVETKQVIALLKTAKIENMSFRDHDNLGLLISSALRSSRETCQDTADLITESETMVDAERSTH